MLKTLCALLSAAALVGCAAPPSSYPVATMGESDIRWGQITHIDRVQIQSGEQFGVGALLGGVAGGVLGHQVGKGHGRTLATVAGTLLGGYAGTRIQEGAQTQAGQHIFVHLQSGVTVGVTQPTDSTLRVGDTVRIDGSGPTARVLRR